MPWTQFSPEPGDYLAERETGEIDLFRREKDDTIVTTAPPATRWRRFLPIPPPSVLLAMEEFIAAERECTRLHLKATNLSEAGDHTAAEAAYMECLAANSRSLETWDALACAEAKEQKVTLEKPHTESDTNWGPN